MGSITVSWCRPSRNCKKARLHLYSHLHAGTDSPHTTQRADTPARPYPATPPPPPPARHRSQQNHRHNGPTEGGGAEGDRAIVRKANLSEEAGASRLSYRGAVEVGSCLAPSFAVSVTLVGLRRNVIPAPRHQHMAQRQKSPRKHIWLGDFQMAKLVFSKTDYERTYGGE